MDARALPLLAGARASPTTSTRAAHCTPFTLPSLGIITLDAETTITLSQDVVFQPACTGNVDLTQNSISSTLTDLRDPFYASTIPQCYALAATTVIAYTLVIMLLVTPRTFLRGGSIILGRRGFTNGPSGEAGIGIGGRPWLQKVATLTVAISLTIATADTFRIAQDQYEIGFMDATSLQQQVLDGTELKVMRIISDTFLWLAQAQTLIRLFPRQREKIIIKWTAFALILLDLIFGILDSFVVSTSYTRPTSFNDAIPALSYLFQLALSVLYCAWVLYYSITKKRYAFYHPEMRNICLVALLSIVALFVPVVFFMTDIINHDVAAWGDYVRWVGAAAASVVVWEWVERIESLERNDKKDGVLGREVFDGDEMLEVTPASDVGHRRRWNGGGGNSASDGKSTSASSANPWPTMTGVVNRYKPRLSIHMRKERGTTREELEAKRLEAPKSTTLQIPSWPARAARIATPISRTDTGSAESTVYAVRYHPINGPNQQTYETPQPLPTLQASNMDIEAQRETSHESGETLMMEKYIARESESDTPELAPPPNSNLRARFWDTMERANPLSRRSRQPPAEISAHAVTVTHSSDSEKPDSTTSNRWDIRGRLEDFASIQAEKFQHKSAIQNATVLPVTRIPAPPRNRTFQEMADLIEEDENRTDSVRHDSNTVVGDESPTMPCTGSQGPTQFTLSGQSSSLARSVYTPGSLDSQYVIQRGTLSIATPMPPRDLEVQSEARSPDLRPMSHQITSPRSIESVSPRAAAFPRTTSSSSRSRVGPRSHGTGATTNRVPAPSTLGSEPTSPRPADMLRTLSTASRTQTDSDAPTMSSASARLPVIRIPAPPRRRRTDEEEDE